MTVAPPAGSATLVVPVALSRIDALAVVALTLDLPVVAAGTAHARIELDGGVWVEVEVEIPKFGDPPPVAVDVHSPVGVEHARLAALGLAARLREVAGWQRATRASRR